MDLSSAFGKKVGDFKKKESESLIFTGLEIPRDYSIINGEREYKGNLEIGLDFLYGYLNMEQ